ncbi:SET domain-containing protein [Cladophialophora immunda]|nr:SET domain-containing protein [Cladophialophora immunda]
MDNHFHFLLNPTSESSGPSRQPPGGMSRQLTGESHTTTRTPVNEPEVIVLSDSDDEPTSNQKATTSTRPVQPAFTGNDGSEKPFDVARERIPPSPPPPTPATAAPSYKTVGDKISVEPVNKAARSATAESTPSNLTAASRISNVSNTFNIGKINTRFIGDFAVKTFGKITIACDAESTNRYPAERARTRPADSPPARPSAPPTSKSFPRTQATAASLMRERDESMATGASEGLSGSQGRRSTSRNTSSDSQRRSTLSESSAPTALLLREGDESIATGAPEGLLGSQTRRLTSRSTWSDSRRKSTPSESSAPTIEQHPDSRNTELSTARHESRSHTLHGRKSRSASRPAVSSATVDSRHESPPVVQDRPNDDAPSDNAAPLSKITPEVADSLICSSCAQGDLECDGRVPACGSCREQGLACSYQRAPNPTKEPPSLLVKLKVRIPAERAASESTEGSSPEEERSQSESVYRESDEDSDSDSDTGSTDWVQRTPLTLVFRAPEPQHPDSEQEEPTDQQSPEDSVMEDEKDQDVEESTSVEEEDRDVEEPSSVDEGWDVDNASDSSGSSIFSAGETTLRPNVPVFFMMLNNLRELLRDWQQRTVLADVKQAKVTAAQRPRPDLDPNLPDPFGELTEQRRSVGNSWDSSAKKDEEIIRAPRRRLSGGTKMLPKFRSIGRLNTSFLAPNYRTARYRAYDAEDEIVDQDASKKYDEFEQRHKIDFLGLAKQRACQELVWLWEPWIEYLFSRLEMFKSDILYFYVQKQFEPDRQIEFDWLVFAGLTAYAFHELVGSSLWHVALGGIIQPRYADSQAATAQDPNLCLICFRHQCPDHGAYEEPSDDEPNIRKSRALINDEESDRNIRKFVSLPRAEPDVENDTHLCGIFCVEPSTSLRKLLGRQPGGMVFGHKRAPRNYNDPKLADDQLCCPSCFWDVNNRRDITVSEVKFQPFMSQKQKVLVESLMGFYLHNKRGPCLISRVIKVSCMMVFNHIIFSIFRVKHSTDPPLAAAEMSLPQPDPNSTLGKKKKKNKKNQAPIIDISESTNLIERELFIPCSHKGPCYDNPACSCAKAKIHCEWFCGCSDSCKRRFRGCNCKIGSRKMCFQDTRCECWKLGRECDPHICLSCGVLDVLDSYNKYKDDIRQGRCRNNRIQLGVPANTTKAPSQVQGYGLYNLVKLSKGEYIGEYVGELVSGREANRRGALYHIQNQEYLFDLIASQEIDASRNGNKMMFMNNSQKEEFRNVEPVPLLCSGQVRIGLFARRDVKAGEELLWKYGYGEEHTKYFWEPGEKPSHERARIPLSYDRLARTAGINRLAGESGRTTQEEGSESPVVRPLQKRKRQVSQSSSTDDESASSSEKETVRDFEIDDPKDADYEANGDVSDEGNLDDDSEDSDLYGPGDIPYVKRATVQQRKRQ